MSGIVIAGALLAGDAALTAVVPTARIKAWLLPQGMPEPSIVVTSISRTEMQFLAGRSVQLVTERVQITVRATSGNQRKTIMKLARDACRDKVGTIAGFDGVAALFAGDGPDFMDDDQTVFMGSFDLRISFNEPA